MPRRIRIHVTAACMLALAFASAAFAEIISGVSTMQLSSPANAAIRNEAITMSADSLKKAVYAWLARTTNDAPDLSNPIRKHFFNVLTKKCVQRAKQDSYFEGHEWTLNLDIKDDEVKEIIAQHNAWCDSIASYNWALVQEGLANNTATVVYNASIHALFYALGKIGAAAEGDAGMESQARAALQQFLEKLSITYSSPIIKGKLGKIAETQITVEALADGVPFPGLTLIARLPNGQKVTSLTTNTEGKAELSNIKMPFVAYGTFMHVIPDFGAIVNPGYIFEPDAFGISLRESQDQTLIFNIIKPVYTLGYQAVAANKVDVPADFASDNRLRKFLEDSCHMEPQAGSKPADLALDIRCQISSYTFDEREQTDLKVEARASIKQGGVDGRAVEKTALLHKKSYDSNHPVPYGLFFWETTNELKALIRQMLAEL